MLKRIHGSGFKVLGAAALAALLGLGSASPALARDHDGHRGGDRWVRHSDRWHRDHHYRGHRHHRYGYWYRDRHYRDHRHYVYPYGAYGVGVITGYLLGQDD
jgi:hypothetical protein